MEGGKRGDRPGNHGGSGEIEVTCPVCKEKVRVKETDAAEKMSVRCSRGHEIPLVRLM